MTPSPDSASDSSLATDRAMRPLIQYDLDEPSTAPGPSASGPLPANANPGAYRPTKKRKRGHHNAAAHKGKAYVQHWDDPGSAGGGVMYDEQEGGAMSYEGEGDDYDEGDEGADVDAEEGEEESRALTHEEIWDDSALVDAWNSAEAEYEAYHGAMKAWKSDPVKKSPLWYNKPYVSPPPKPGPSKPQLPSKGKAKVNGEPEADTAPLDFDTYVPTHDPSLPGASAQTAQTATPAPFFVPPPSTIAVSRDEAFNNALSAMYWGGYWTAVYHCQTQTHANEESKTCDEPTEDGVEADENDKDDEDQDLVPTQR